jgi:hypothetical protein
MDELARRWSELLLSDRDLDDMPVTRAAREAESLLREPASQSDIAAAEERLGRRLPPSYREFLLVSDGAYGDLYGASPTFSESGWEVARRESTVIGVGFLPVADLRWLREADPVLAEICRDADLGSERGPAVIDGADLESWTAFSDGLKIAVDWQPGTTCLVPFDGMEEWQVWNIHKETGVGFLSFRSMLEYHVADREPITQMNEFQEVLLWASAGDHRAARRLSRTTTPEAVPMLIALVDDRILARAAAAALGRVATLESVEALAHMEPGQSSAALAMAGTDRARDVLAERGDYYRLSLLGDPRGPQLAADRLARRSASDTPQSLNTALLALARSRDERFVPLVLPLLSEEPELALSAAGTLAWLGAPHGRARIVSLAEEAGPARARALSMLRRLDAGYLP